MLVGLKVFLSALISLISPRSFLTRKHLSFLNSLWLLKSLTVEKVRFCQEKKKERKVICDLPLVSTECASPFSSPSLSSLFFL